jgi:hypothetical protein
MVRGAPQIALFGCAKLAYRRLAAQALSISGLISKLLGGSQIIACETTIVRELFLKSHQIMDPTAGAAGEQLAVPQIDRPFVQNFRFGVQLDIRLSQLSTTL